MQFGDVIKQELLQASDVLDDLLRANATLSSIEEAAYLFAECFKSGGKAISCGNGGSHCDAMHFAEELSGRFRDDREPFAALAISDPSHISCVANDYGYNQVFARFLKGVANENDVLLAISTSGKSANVIEAIKVAKEKGMKVVGLTGNGGGQMHNLVDVEICVPHFGYADRIQEVHIKIIHILILLIEKLTK